MALLDYSEGIVKGLAILGEKTPYEKTIEAAEAEMKFLGSNAAISLRAAQAKDSAARSVLRQNNEHSLLLQNMINLPSIRGKPQVQSALEKYATTIPYMELKRMGEQIVAKDFNGFINVPKGDTTLQNAFDIGTISLFMETEEEGKFYLPDPYGAEAKMRLLLGRASFGVNALMQKQGLSEEEAYEKFFQEGLTPNEQDRFTYHWTTFTNSIDKTMNYFDERILPTYTGVTRKLQRDRMKQFRRGATEEDRRTAEATEELAKFHYTKAQYATVLREFMGPYITSAALMYEPQQLTFMKNQILNNTDMMKRFWERMKEKYPSNVPDSRARPLTSVTGQLQDVDKVDINTLRTYFDPSEISSLGRL